MTLNDSVFAQAWEALSAAKTTRKTAVQRLVAARASEPAWCRFFASNAERLEKRGPLGLLAAATARPADDEVRRAAEAWLEQSGDSVPAWLRTVDGPPLSPQPDPVWRCQAIPDGAGGLCRAPNGHLWVWGLGGRFEVHEWDPIGRKRVRKVRTQFEPNSVDVNAEGWLAVSARGGESTVLVWNEKHERVHKVDTGRDMANVCWVPDPAPALLVVDGGVCLFHLKRKAHPAWRHERRDRNAGPPIQHAALLPGGTQVLSLEIEDGGAARVCTLRLSDGELLRSVDLAPVFPKADPLGAMAISPSGARFAFGHTLINDGIRVFELATGELLRQVLPERGKVTVLRFATDRELWCGTGEGLVLRIDIDSGVAPWAARESGCRDRARPNW